MLSSNSKLRTPKKYTEKKLNKFLGSTIYVKFDSRTELPFKKADEPLNYWKLIKANLGKDITKVSMPVWLNEP